MYFRIAEYVLHVWGFVLHEDGESGGILAAGERKNVSDWLGGGTAHDGVPFTTGTTALVVRLRLDRAAARIRERSISISSSARVGI